MTSPAAEIKRHGKHYTPSALADFLAQRLLANVYGSALRVLDPACGDGELLLAVARAAPDRAVTLVGYDLDPAALDLAGRRAEVLGVRLDLHHGDFLDLARDLEPGSFDAVISNPPYVRTQQLGSEAAQVLATRFGLRGRIDLTHPFVTLLPAVLRDGGGLALLCSNRFLTTRAGANVREVLHRDLGVAELYDLGDTRLFAASVLPAVVVARKGERHRRPVFVTAYSDPAATPAGPTSLFEALTGADATVAHEGRAVVVRHGVLDARPGEPWRQSHPGGDAWLAQVQAATWKTFGEVAKIRVGIKTTADAVFIDDDWSGPDTPEPDLLRPLLTHADVDAWHVAREPAARVLYPYDLDAAPRRPVDLSRYPRAATYLESHRGRLAGRRYVTDAGREWFEPWVPHQPSAWAAPKIVFPDISVAPRFALDTSGAVVNGDCYWISTADLADPDLALLMLAVGNSSLAVRFYDEVCGNRLYAGRRRWMTQYVSRFPLPDPAARASRALTQAARDGLAGAGLPTSEQLEPLVAEAFGLP